jgi:hypothetical protein
MTRSLAIVGQLWLSAMGVMLVVGNASVMLVVVVVIVVVVVGLFVVRRQKRWVPDRAFCWLATKAVRQEEWRASVGHVD